MEADGSRPRWHSMGKGWSALLPLPFGSPLVLSLPSTPQVTSPSLQTTATPLPASKPSHHSRSFRAHPHRMINGLWNKDVPPVTSAFAEGTSESQGQAGLGRLSKSYHPPTPFFFPSSPPAPCTPQHRLLIGRVINIGRQALLTVTKPTCKRAQ